MRNTGNTCGCAVIYARSMDAGVGRRLVELLGNESTTQKPVLVTPQGMFVPNKIVELSRSFVLESDATLAASSTWERPAAMFITVDGADARVLQRRVDRLVALARNSATQKMALIAPRCSAGSDLGKALKEACETVRQSYPNSLVVRHAPLFDELLRHELELKYRRTLSLPDLPATRWIAAESVADTCRRWLEQPIEAPLDLNLEGQEPINGASAAKVISQAFRDYLNPEEFPRRRFAAIDWNQDGRLERAEFVRYLVGIGCTAGEAEIIWQNADRDGVGAIGLAEFAKGCSELISTVLADVPAEITYLPVSWTAFRHDLRAASPDEVSARDLANHWQDISQAGESPDNSIADATRDRIVSPTSKSLAEWVKEQTPDWMNVHILPTFGVLVGGEGLLDGQRAYVSTLELGVGGRLSMQRTHDSRAVEMHWSSDDATGNERIEYQAPTGEKRALVLSKGRVVGVSIRGAWAGLRLVGPMLHHRQTIPRWQVALFRELGELQIEDAVPRADNDIVCNCAQVTCRDILNLIDRGCRSTETIAAACRATTICGGCKPLVEEFVGSSTLQVAELLSREQLNDSIVRFRFRPATAVVLFSEPGQHILIQGRMDDRWVTRAYTLTSPAGQGDYYEITVKREENGVFSRWLCDRADGESLFRISDPRGDFVLDPKARDVIFFAAGVGVTPALAMIRTLVQRGDSRRFRLDWSISTPKQLLFQQELSAAAASLPGFSFVTRCTRSDGRLDAATIARLYPPGGSTSAFLCGPSSYADSIRSFLIQTGWSDGAIRQEAFGSRLNAEGRVKPIVRPRAALHVSGDIAPIEQESFDLEPPGSVSSEAAAFLKQCYFEQDLATVFQPRWDEVRTSIENIGTYTHSFDELSYGAKLAWRNSNRCLGRDFWLNLDLRDMRHLNTEKEMFEAILDHIQCATNRGDIRPTITIFRPDGRRIWNSQFFRYAGYRQPDGSVLGDPLNVALTEAAIRLGWKKEHRGRFDYLPLIIQLPGRTPAFFDIPPSLILEAPLVHPEYSWFAELGLKWYGLPAVSSMAFDLGGVRYTAAPFNGFYMGAEIGARNFSDVDRYDMLPVIADRIGLDRRDDRSLWRDRTLVELNIAVLHSFSHRGIRLLDHHTLTRSFMQFMDREKSAGRPIQADRNYIVPPISPATTPVFHINLDSNRKLKPGFFYQPDPWIVQSSH